MDGHVRPNVLGRLLLLVVLLGNLVSTMSESLGLFFCRVRMMRSYLHIWIYLALVDHTTNRIICTAAVATVPAFSSLPPDLSFPRPVPHFWVT